MSIFHDHNSHQLSGKYTLYSFVFFFDSGTVCHGDDFIDLPLFFPSILHLKTSLIFISYSIDTFVLCFSKKGFTRKKLAASACVSSRPLSQQKMTQFIFFALIVQYSFIQLPSYFIFFSSANNRTRISSFFSCKKRRCDQVDVAAICRFI